MNPSDKVVDVSFTDKREYRHITLGNELDVLLVHDAETEVSAASLSVGVGSLCDPTNLNGLAHFLEHMLFLGTASYPDEHAFDEFLSTHGGNSNAYTASEETNFYFQVGTSGFQEALQRFSCFFYEAIFNPESVEKELQAIDSEHAKNITSESWRLPQVLVDAAYSRDSPAFQFTTGNLETLRDKPLRDGLDIRQEVIAFYQRHYSSNLMKLALCSSISLDDMETYVRSYFEQIPNHHRQKPAWPDTPLLRAEVQAMKIQFVPATQTKMLQLKWLVPPQEPHWRTKPFEYIANMLGHEGAGSALARLKADDLAVDLCAGLTGDLPGGAFFQVTCTLSEKGEDNPDAVIWIIYSYLTLLRKEGGIQRKHWQELSTLATIEFHWAACLKAMQSVLFISAALHTYPPRYMYSANFLYFEYSEAQIRESLACLQPSNMIVLHGSAKFSAICTETERFYGTRYTVSQISEEKLLAWSDSPRLKDLHLPRPNDFIPRSFSIRQNSRPSVLLPDDFYRATAVQRGVWYWQDINAFCRPKTACFIGLWHQNVGATVNLVMLNEFFWEGVREILVPVTYEASLAGLELDINVRAYGGEIRFFGFSSGVHRLLQTVLVSLRAFAEHMSEEIFRIVYARKKDELQDELAEHVYLQARYLGRKFLLRQGPFETPEKLAYLATGPELTEVLDFAQSYLEQSRIQMFVAGNCDEDDVRSLSAVVGEYLPFRETSWEKEAPIIEAPSCVALEAGMHVHLSKLADIDSAPCSGLSMTFQYQVETPRSSVLTQLLVRWIAQKAYAQLRTVEQLGYVCLFTCSVMGSVIHLSFLVESSVMDPLGLEARIEAFLEHYRQELAAMTAEELQHRRETLIATLEDPPKRLFNLATQLWREIATRKYCFSRRMQERSVLKEESIAVTDLLDLYDRVLLDPNTRRVVTACVFGEPHRALASQVPTNTIRKEDLVYHNNPVHTEMR